MDRPSLTIEIFDPLQAHARPLSSPDHEARGRRRCRDPLHYLIARPRPRQSSALRGRCRHRSPSRLSLAGAGACRAASSCRGGHAPGGGCEDLCPGSAAGSPVVSPTTDKRRYYLGVPAVTTPETQRQSRSPSRSRSPGAVCSGGQGGGAGAGVMMMMGGKGVAAAADVVMPYVMGQRRRQRAQSRNRGRRHGLEEAFAPGGRAGRSPLVGMGVWTSEEVCASEED